MNMIRAAAIIVVGVVLSAPYTNAQAAKVNVTGKWLFNVETGAGSGTPTMTFTQDGEKLTGKYQGSVRRGRSHGNGEGQDIAFSFNVDAQGTAVTFNHAPEPSRTRTR